MKFAKRALGIALGSALLVASPFVYAEQRGPAPVAASVPALRVKVTQRISAPSDTSKRARFSDVGAKATIKLKGPDHAIAANQIANQTTKSGVPAPAVRQTRWSSKLTYRISEHQDRTIPALAHDEAVARVENHTNHIRAAVGNVEQAAAPRSEPTKGAAQRARARKNP